MFNFFGPKKRMMMPLYNQSVLAARQPHWYLAGQVPDNIDGRFELLSTFIALALIRLEKSSMKREAVLLTEIFIDDMDGQMREFGIGADMIGKRMGKLLSVLGGRINLLVEARSEGEGEDTGLHQHITRNIFRGEPPEGQALLHVANELRRHAVYLHAMSDEELLKGAHSEA